MKIDREFDEYGYHVEAEKKEYCVNFEIFENPEKQTPEIIGFVKWDGCSNWHFPAESFQLHFCAKRQVIDFGVFLSKLYEWAMELMPEYKEYLE